MGKHIQIGALVEKEHGLSAYNEIASSKGVLYAFLETGRSNPYFLFTRANCSLLSF